MLISPVRGEVSNQTEKCARGKLMLTSNLVVSAEWIKSPDGPGCAFISFQGGNR